jgi:hypothetical protein
MNTSEHHSLVFMPSCLSTSLTLTETWRMSETFGKFIGALKTIAFVLAQRLV